MKSISGKIFPRKAWMYTHEADLVKEWEIFLALYKACGPGYMSSPRINHKTSRIHQHLEETYGFDLK